MVQTALLTAIIGAIGGVVGSVAGALALRDRWRHRKPILRLFAPYQFIGTNSGSGERTLILLLRISNLSRANAFLYLETLACKVRNGENWFPTTVLQVPPDVNRFKTNLPSHQQLQFGLHEVGPLRRYTNPVVSLSEPLTGYVVLTCNDPTILESPDAIQVSVRDCQFRLYKMVVDFAEQRRRYDPTWGSMGSGEGEVKQGA
jgi:hypothetical protein